MTGDALTWMSVVAGVGFVVSGLGIVFGIGLAAVPKKRVWYGWGIVVIGVLMILTEFISDHMLAP